MEKSWETIIVGAGIAGLGVGALLCSEAQHKVLILDRFQRPGGRLMAIPNCPHPGWCVDIGLHMTELGEKSSIQALNARAGVKVNWGPFSQKVLIYQQNRWTDLAELVPLSEADRKAFKALLGQISGLTDQTLETWDNRSLAEWLEENVASAAVREVFADLGMIMTTIPSARDMAAGEVLWIARTNLQRMRQVLASGYPIGGMGALTQGLVKVVEAGGGEVRCGTLVQSVIIENGRAAGVRVVSSRSEYPADFRIPETVELRAERVVLALPIYQLDAVLDFHPRTSPLPEWWLRRIRDIEHEVTGLIGYVLGLREPVVEGPCFLSALKCRHTGLPFQGFPASNFSPEVAPPGRQLLYTDCVIEYPEVSDRFERERQLRAMWEDLREMFPGFEDKLEWSLPYYVAGCDGLARKPGLVGRFKPELTAPGIANLYFAGDTYQGRGLAMNSAALSAMTAADRILADGKTEKA